MIADVLSILVIPKSVRVFRGTLTKQRVANDLDKIRSSLGARTLHKQLRTPDANSGVIWSLWIGRFEKRISWLSTSRFKEIRYAFALAMESNGYVGVCGSSIGAGGTPLSDDPVDYEKLLALHSGPNTEIESLTTRSLRAAGIGVMRSTQTGRHLEKALSRVGANQAAPARLGLRLGDHGWKISPSSGRVALSGGRASVPDLCAWFASTCADIESSTEPSDFIKAFAHPVSLDRLADNISPTAVQLDSSIIDDLIESGATLERNGAPMTEAAISSLHQVVGQLWDVDPVRSQADKAAKTWRLVAGGGSVGYLVVRSSKISLTSPALSEIRVLEEGGSAVSLNHVYNDGSQPLRITFSDPSYAYAAGQLFRDHRLMASSTALLEVLSDRLPATPIPEKGLHNDRFAPDSLFGFVVEHASANDDFLVCDDIATELADFIGVSTLRHEITFYHCKGGHTDVGASDLHEVVAQAAKNLGFLTATRAELETRQAKWEGVWNQTAVPRLQRGASVEEFIAQFGKSVVAPQSTRRVTLVTSSLSKSALASALAEVANGTIRPEASHALWLLLIFVDQCRSVGAIPEIFCRP